jgi:hypothetical protein
MLILNQKPSGRYRQLGGLLPGQVASSRLITQPLSVPGTGTAWAKTRFLAAVFSLRPPRLRGELQVPQLGITSQAALTGCGNRVRIRMMSHVWEIPWVS